MLSTDNLLQNSQAATAAKVESLAKLYYQQPVAAKLGITATSVRTAHITKG